MCRISAVSAVSPQSIRTAFEFYSCFISYSGKDEEFAKRIFADLQQEGVRCWFAPHHVQSGKKLHEQIDVAIRLHERLLLILSPDSINSEWVKTEIAKARKRGIKEGKRVLFPIRLNISYEQLQEWECFDADRGKDSAREIAEYYIPDFTKWKDHDQYQEEFKRLVRDLKKGDVRATYGFSRPEGWCLSQGCMLRSCGMVEVALPTLDYLWVEKGRAPKSGRQQGWAA
jgi:hypothetical protein